MFPRPMMRWLAWFIYKMLLIAQPSWFADILDVCYFIFQCNFLFVIGCHLIFQFYSYLSDDIISYLLIYYFLFAEIFRICWFLISYLLIYYFLFADFLFLICLYIISYLLISYFLFAHILFLFCQTTRERRHSRVICWVSLFRLRQVPQLTFFSWFGLG